MEHSTLPLLGARIRQLRQEAGITLTELAARSGVSKGLLSKVENGKVTPSLPVLLSFIKALSLKPEVFFQGIDLDAPEAYIHKKPWELELSDAADEAEGVNKRSILTEAFSGGTLEAFLLEVDPGSGREPEMVGSPEFIYLLQGNVELQLDEEIIAMGKGDTLYHDGRRAGAPFNKSSSTTRMLVLRIRKE